MYTRKQILGLCFATSLVATSLVACGGSDFGGNGGGDGGNAPGDLDPNNPPPSPFPDDSFPDDGVCGDVNAVVDGLTPTVQLLIDQSGSMDANFGNTDRWRAVYNTLMGNAGVVNSLQSTIRFGLSLYTSYDGNAGNTCPALTNVDASLSNFNAIDTVYGSAPLGRDTPTGESIDAVVTLLQQDNNPGRKVIVLGTDGEPDTCAEPNPQNGQALAIAAAKRSFEAGIRVYVISVGSDVSAQHLQDMANAGAGLPLDGVENAEYFVANQPQDLVDAFGTIVGGVAGCIFTINGQVDVPKASQGKVALDGTELSFPDEWKMLDGKTFEILGQACETIKDGQLHHVSAAFPCGSIIIN